MQKACDRRILLCMTINMLIKESFWTPPKFLGEMGILEEQRKGYKKKNCKKKCKKIPEGKHEPGSKPRGMGGKDGIPVQGDKKNEKE